jgi:lipopolysaccharide/colanic/teichoic acid biosynthesis glycosyltransferase
MSNNQSGTVYTKKASPDATNDRLKIDYTTILRDGVITAGQSIISTIAIALSLPIIALITLIIRIDSPGPAIFKQVRIGKDRRGDGRQRLRDEAGLGPERRKKDLGGKPFIFYKFRTMFVDAKERYPDLYRYEYDPEEIKTFYFKVADDPRLTRFGRHLRKTTLDELPNFINVLKGDMSLVGPRPEIPQMIKYYRGEQRNKFKVKPGLTGLCQVNGRGLLSFQESQRLDVEYIKNKTVWFDFKILLTTLKVSIFRIGAF